MKRLLVCLLAAVMLLSLTACNSLVSDFKEGLQEGIENAGNELNKTVTRGVIDGNTYTSAYSGLSFTSPGSWRFMTDAELSAATNAGMEIVDQDTFNEALATMASVYDAMATDDATGNNIIFSYENLSLSNSTSITLEDYIAAVEQQLAAQEAFTATFGEKKTVELCGNSYYRTECTMVYSGITMSQFYYVRKIDKYMNVVIVTLVDGSDISDIEAMFQN